MVTINGTTNKPCFICGDTDSVEVQFRGRTFIGVLCREHLWERLTPVREKKKAEKKTQGNGSADDDEE